MGVNEDKPCPLKEDPREEVRRGWQGAVLLSDEIAFYAQQKECPLIYPFEPDNLKPARYKLRLGEDCRVGGKEYWLSEENPDLIIQPYELAVISTLETLNLPRFLIGRWDLKVKRVYEGLLWVGGPQVDPGYRGKLFCPLYNLSNRRIALKYGDTIATIDFIRTTPYNENCKDWDGRPNAPRAYYDQYGLMSGLSDAWERMAGFESRMKTNESKVNRFESRIDTFQVITFTVLGIIVAALAFIGTSKFGGMSAKTPTAWQIATWITVLSGIVALAGFLIYAGVKTMRRNKKKGDPDGKNNKL